MSFCPARKIVLWLLLASIALFLLNACGGTTTGSTPNAGSQTIAVVAAENFYGDMVKQLGGSHVDVQSILSDPNVDPHEYEANTKSALAVSKAQLVIENGGGYDGWMDKLLSSSPNSSRVVIKAFDVAKVKLPDNEHVWYSIDNAHTIAQAITDSLKKLDPANATEFDSNLQKFQAALQPVQQKIAEIKAKHASVPVGLTETIFLYQSGPLGLNLLTPPEFQKAIAEGNDPPANAVIIAENQITKRQIKVLIFNEQTITPITTKLENDAKSNNIPTVSVTETMPSSKTYQNWMLDQLNALEQALGQS
jgi:zinc/manganese transport system substrate-binding protein